MATLFSGQPIHRPALRSFVLRHPGVSFSRPGRDDAVFALRLAGLGTGRQLARRSDFLPAATGLRFVRRIWQSDHDQTCYLRSFFFVHRLTSRAFLGNCFYSPTCYLRKGSVMRTTYRSEWVRCGKNCHGCPHGPYWYAYWREGKKLHKRYVGKELPAWCGGPELEPPHPHDGIFSSRTASASLAYEILGLSHQAADFASVRRAYRDLMARNHPDRGGSELIGKRLNCAFAYLKAWLGC